MTKKDYILIADILANRFEQVDNWHGDEKMHTLTEIITICEDFINMLEKDNPHFDRVKFIAYINNKRAGNE